MMHRVEQALARGLAGKETLLDGYLNDILAQLCNQSEEKLATAISNQGLE